jgi:hypothetical protein
LQYSDDLVFVSNTTARVARYYSDLRGQGKPLFNGEIGATQRWMKTEAGPLGYQIGEPAQLAGNHTDPPPPPHTRANYEHREKSVSGYHYALWSSLLSGACATPLQWCDGKEFGEMQHRDYAGSCDLFKPKNYEIDFFGAMRPIHRLLSRKVEGVPAVNPWDYAPLDPKRVVLGYERLALVRRQGEGLRGIVWVLQTSEDVAAKGERLLDIADVARPGDRVQWYDPWMGVKIGDPILVPNSMKVNFWANGMEKVEPDGYGQRRHREQDIVGLILEGAGP